MKSLNYPVVNPEESSFEIIYADVTHRCNMNCSNCYIPNRDFPDMNIELFKNFISRLSQPTEIRLIGGEPTLNPELASFIRAVNFFGHRPVLVTNGLKLAKQDYIQELVSAGLKYVYISASGFDDNKVYAITDQMNCAEQKISAIKNAEKFGLEIGIGCLLMKNINTHIVPQLISFSGKLGVATRLNFRNVGKIGRYIKDTENHLNMNDMVKLLSTATRITEKNIFRFQLTPHQIRFPLKIFEKKIWIKLTDWQPEGYFLPDPNSQRRGRITQDFKVAPFFEHVKENELGY